MEFAPLVTANPSLFTRIYFAASLVIFSLLPLILTAMFAGSEASEDLTEIQTLIVEIVTLQGLLWFAHYRCGTPERPYWRSLLVISSCLRTGWSTFDTIFVPVGLSGAMALSCALALSRNAPQRMSRLVYWFYQRRMVQ